MQDANLDALEADAAALDAQTMGDDSYAADKPEAAQAAPEMDWSALLAPIISVAGSIITSRANVAPLQSVEIEQLAAATGRLLDLYDVPIGGPKAQAWIGFAGVVSAIVITRVPTEGAEQSAGGQSAASEQATGGGLIDPAMGSRADARAREAGPVA